MPEISVIIVNYNAGEYLNKCLNSLFMQDYQGFEVLVVDNASTDGSMKNLPDDPRLHCINLDKNIGFAAANNHAANLAKGEWLALLNPDAFPEKDWLTQLMNATQNYPDFSFFGSTQICADNPALLDGTGDMYHILGIPARSNFHRPIEHLPETGEIFAPCAAAALYRKDVFLGAGGFDEDFFCYCEDVDLAFRLRLQGERCLQVKEAIVHHIGSAITGVSSDFAVYHGIRNRFWLFFKNMPTPLFIPLIVLHLMVQDLFFLRAIMKGHGGNAWRAWADIIETFPKLWKKRQNIQKSRTVSLIALLKVFTYSPTTLVFRRSAVRPVIDS